jgi:hypothetical protein
MTLVEFLAKRQGVSPINPHRDSSDASHNFRFMRIAKGLDFLRRIWMRYQSKQAVLQLAPPARVPMPDVGEVRGQEAFDLLQLLNTGHAGTISTIHANSAREGLSRFTSCVLQSGIEVPYRAVKNSIADSLDVVVHLERRPGRRTISEVVEVGRYDPDSDMFEFKAVFQRQDVAS